MPPDSRLSRSETPSDEAVKRWKRIEKAARAVLDADSHYGQTLRTGTRADERAALAEVSTATGKLREALDA